MTPSPPPGERHRSPHARISRSPTLLCVVMPSPGVETRSKCKVRPASANLCRRWPNLSQTWPNLANPWTPSFAEVCLVFANTWQHWRELAQSVQKWPNLQRISTLRATCGANSEVGGIAGNPCDCWGQLGGGVGELCSLCRERCFDGRRHHKCSGKLLRPTLWRPSP